MMPFWHHQGPMLTTFDYSETVLTFVYMISSITLYLRCGFEIDTPWGKLGTGKRSVLWQGISGLIHLHNAFENVICKILHILAHFVVNKTSQLPLYRCKLLSAKMASRVQSSGSGTQLPLITEGQGLVSPPPATRSPNSKEQAALWAADVRHR